MHRKNKTIWINSLYKERKSSYNSKGTIETEFKKIKEFLRKGYGMDVYS